eukprot:TRINITY_DN12957_c0_g1_i1.p1 TRINITY_DN12957_c0_g1~~TRINITY_DN12957_c0_g1_i1.p1  ORF type:complete len:173 (+),score=40.39 TRINITY_DN12957_c0_g1_i1:573-1091(+)
MLSNLPTHAVEYRIADSIDFIVKHFEELSQEEVASRMMLCCYPGPLVASDLPMDHNRITIIDTNDEVLIPQNIREEVFQTYSRGAHQASLKSGGNFPFLSRDDEFTMHLEVHLRRCHYYRHGVDKPEEQFDLFQKVGRGLGEEEGEGEREREREQYQGHGESQGEDEGEGQR